MGDLKCFSDIIFGPIIAVHSSNNVSWRPPTPKCENRVKGDVDRVTWPRKFLGVKCYSSKTAEFIRTSNFTGVFPTSQWQSWHDPDKCFRKVVVVTVTWPCNFWEL